MRSAIITADARRVVEDFHGHVAGHAGNSCMAPFPGGCSVYAQRERGRIFAASAGLNIDCHPRGPPSLCQALHVAVIRGGVPAVEALLAAGAEVGARNTRHWNALDEAIARDDEPMVRLLYPALRAEWKREKARKKAQLLQVLRELPDFTYQVNVGGGCVRGTTASHGGLACRRQSQSATGGLFPPSSLPVSHPPSRPPTRPSLTASCS